MSWGAFSVSVNNGLESRLYKACESICHFLIKLLIYPVFVGDTAEKTL